MQLQLHQTTRAVIEYIFLPKPEAPTLLFVHGLGSNLSQFSEQVDYFSDHFQVVAVNLHGHGNSTSAGSFSLTRCAQDLVDLLDALDVGRFHFIGNSMGGNIGYELLHLIKSRLLSITTFGTTAQLNTSAATTKILTTLYRMLPIRYIARLAGQAGQTAASKQTVKTMMAQADKETLLQIVPTIAKFNYLPILSDSHTPILLIKGGKDRDINKALASTLHTLEKRGGFTKVDLADAGHFANLDDSDQFNQILLNFLSSIENRDG